MDSLVLQRTRYLLQARTRAAKTCPVPLLPSSCSQFLSWIDGALIVRSLLAPLETQAKQFEAQISADVAKWGTPALGTVRGPVDPKTREEAAALSLAALRVTTRLDFSEPRRHEPHMLGFLLAGQQSTDVDEAAEAVRDVAVEGLYEYLDERLDERNAVLGLLVKYKQRCEWYRRGRLLGAATDGMEGLSGERALANDLYEYLHDQGVEFAVESKSASGAPDLVSLALSPRLVADAKYIRVVDSPRDAQKILASGFRQVLDYCRDHNEPTGYLVAFVARDLKIEVLGDRDDGFECLRVGGNTVYYVVIDIHQHAVTASKRPAPQVVTLTREDVLKEPAEMPPVGGGEAS